MRWKWSAREPSQPPGSAYLGLGLLAGGTITDSALLLAMAWVAALDAFQTAYVEDAPRRLLVLPLLGFPWVNQTLQSLGWLFRFTGARAVQGLFTICGLPVHREGTLLLIKDLPLSIEPACAGLNVLQSTLIVGCLLICARLSGWRFWAAMGTLLPLAWLANTIRIFMLGCAGLWIGPDFANGWFHKWGGWLVLCLMFLLCESLFSLLTARKRDAIAA